MATLSTRLHLNRNNTASDISYLRWAKLRSTAAFNLATSGIQNFPLSRLPVDLTDLEINGPGLYGDPGLRERLSGKTGAPEENLVLSIGTSMANFIALGAMMEPGDHVLIERPTYQPLLRIAEWLGARIERFDRDPTRDWQVDLEQLEKMLRPNSKAVVLSNLHNPSSALLDHDALGQIGAMAERAGANVLVDEVYLESMFDEPPRSSFFLGPNFVATSSLTKAYGLSGLRCGWILAPSHLVRPMSDLIDLTYGILAYPAERLSVIALDHLALIGDVARALLHRNRTLVNDFLRAHRAHLSCEESEFGTTVAPSLSHGDVEAFAGDLRQRLDTSVVPGSFFEAPRHFRIGLGGPTEILQPGLERISDALQKLR